MAAPVFRFAPSPNGELHLGHAYSALVDDRLCRAAGGRFLLRFEDIDAARCRPEFERQALDDLGFLGIAWETPVRRQSEHFEAYRKALEALMRKGLVYPAFLSRGEIRARMDASEAATGRPWPRDPDGTPLYPGDDRALDAAAAEALIAENRPYAFRLRMAEAIAAARALTGDLSFEETGAGPDGETGRIPADPARWGDVIVARKDVPTSYHLSVVVDDARQGVTHVVRGRDLFHATSVHRLLQTLLGLPAPVYHHHRLILDPSGRKLSKSLGDTSLKTLRAAGHSAADIMAMVGLA
jgi:glutamyl-Q tRNA(Asp) synthetase